MSEDKVCREITQEESLIKGIKIVLLNNILGAQNKDDCCKAVEAYCKFVLTEKDLKVK